MAASFIIKMFKGLDDKYVFDLIVLAEIVLILTAWILMRKK